ncbi:MAG: MerR family transcriptional regulator [Thermodesulfobacteriota bacterium]
MRNFNSEDPEGAKLFTISTAAALLALHPRTLRNYEKAGLIKPARRGAWRYYSRNDLTWIRCLFEMIHCRGISIAAIVKLLRYAPCWEVAECDPAQRGHCMVGGAANCSVTGATAPRSTSVRCVAAPGV